MASVSANITKIIADNLTLITTFIYFVRRSIIERKIVETSFQQN